MNQRIRSQHSDCVLAWPGRRHQLRRHMALICHPIHNDRRYTYGHAAQVGLCQGRRQGERVQNSGDSSGDSSDDSPSDVTPEAEECATAEWDASTAEVR